MKNTTFSQAVNNSIIGKFFRKYSTYVPLMVTALLFVILFGVGSLMYAHRNFFAVQNFLNLLINNAHLGIIAVGMTFVIISGGIDLSVGSVMAFTTVLSAFLVQKLGWSPLVVIPLVLGIGLFFGMFQGFLIHKFKLEPFIITLAGKYFARGMCFVISLVSITIEEQFYMDVGLLRIPIPFLGSTSISVNVVILLIIVVAGLFLASYTKFGRGIYAMGGNEQSAVLMGLPVGRNKLWTYSFSGFCSALAGVVFTFYMLSGNPLTHGDGLELDAIVAVAVGGTLLTGGVGNIFGTVMGVFLLGTIQTIINYNGQMSAWWTKIFIGVLLFVFCLLQKLFERKESSSIGGGTGN